MKYKPKGIQKMPDITYYQNMKDHPEFGTKPANFPARISMKKKSSIRTSTDPKIIRRFKMSSAEKYIKSWKSSHTETMLILYS